MPNYILTAAQKAAIDSILGAALSFGTTGVRTGLINGTSYTAMAVEFSPQFTPAAAATLPINTLPPTISGLATEGQTLTGATGTWTGTTPITYTLQWRRNGTPISGATTTTYLVGAGDIGATLSLAVVATNVAGSSAPAVSAGVGPVSAAGGAFSPASLFAGNIGWVYDTSDLSTLFQDRAGTVPVTEAGQPVGFQRDLSGNNLHRTAPSDAQRPILQLDEDGRPYLQVTSGNLTAMSTATHVWGTDEHTLCTGMQRTSATGATIYERSASTSSFDGAFSLIHRVLSGRQTFATVNRGTTRRFLDLTGTHAEPGKFSILQSGKLSGPFTRVRINGVSVLDDGSSLGSGVYGEHAMFFFARNAAELASTLREYTSVGINRVLTDAERDDLETWTTARHSGAAMSVGSGPDLPPQDIIFTPSTITEASAVGTEAGSFS